MMLHSSSSTNGFGQERIQIMTRRPFWLLVGSPDEQPIRLESDTRSAQGGGGHKKDDLLAHADMTSPMFYQGPESSILRPILIRNAAQLQCCHHHEEEEEADTNLFLDLGPSLYSSSYQYIGTWNWRFFKLIALALDFVTRLGALIENGQLWKAAAHFDGSCSAPI